MFCEISGISKEKRSLLQRTKIFANFWVISKKKKVETAFTLRKNKKIGILALARTLTLTQTLTLALTLKLILTQT